MFIFDTSAHHTMTPWSQQSLEASPPASASAGSASRIQRLLGRPGGGSQLATAASRTGGDGGDGMEGILYCVCVGKID